MYQVETIYVHESFTSGVASKGFDIALLKLDEDVEFNDNIQPVCLPPKDHDWPEGTEFVVTGWGNAYGRLMVHFRKTLWNTQHRIYRKNAARYRSISYLCLSKDLVNNFKENMTRLMWSVLCLLMNQQRCLLEDLELSKSVFYLLFSSALATELRLSCTNLSICHCISKVDICSTYTSVSA